MSIRKNANGRQHAVKRALALFLSAALILGNTGVSFAGEALQRDEKIESLAEVQEGVAAENSAEVQEDVKGAEDAEEAPSSKRKAGEEENTNTAEQKHDAEKKTEEKDEVNARTESGASANEEGDAVEEAAASEMVFENDDVKITVSEQKEGVIPTGVNLKATPIVRGDKANEEEGLLGYEDVEKKLNEKAAGEEYEIAGFLAYDIKLVDKDGNEVEPSGEVKVSMEYKKAVAPEGVDAETVKGADVTVMHLEENEKGEVVEVVDLSEVIPEGKTEKQAENKIEKIEKDEKNAVKTATFTTGSFSYYVVIWGQPTPEDLDGAYQKQTATAGRFTVTAICKEEAGIPAEATFCVTEFPAGSKEFQEKQGESGANFDWLIDVGFYLDGKEIEPTAPVQIYMEIAGMESGEQLGLIHFAENGTETFAPSDLNTVVDDDGVGTVQLALDSFSLVGGVTYHTAQVVDTITPGKEYLIYAVTTDKKQCYFLYEADGDVRAPYKVDVSDLNATGDVTQIGTTLYFQDGWDPSKNKIPNPNIHWVATQNSSGNDWYFTTGTRYLTLHDNIPRDHYSICAQHYTTDRRKPDAVSVRDFNGRKYIARSGSNQYINYNNWTGSFTYPNYNDGVVFYFAEIGADYTHSGSTTTNYPQAVYTDTITKSSRYFYNVTDSAGKFVGLGGVKYGIYEGTTAADATGTPKFTIETTSAFTLSLENLKLDANKTYVMKQLSVPDGYVRNPEVWRFTAAANQKILDMEELSTGTHTGIIFNSRKGDTEYKKTAEVYDYKNRTYKVDLSAKTMLRKYRIDPMKLTLVVDQSNSMLFPANMQQIGTTIKIADKDKNNSNLSNLDKYINYASSSDEVFYVIADESSTSTVFAVWKTNGHWYYQDASYYAKAYWKTTIKDPTKIKTNDIIQFPAEGSGYGSTTHGGDFSQVVGGTLGGENGKNLQVYRSADVYNRLHYLEESMVMLIEGIGSISPSSEITLDTFTSDPQECVTKTLNAQGVEDLINTVGNITTTGGTRQDLALKHVIDNNHIASGKPNYLILITDGAPVVGSGQNVQVGQWTNDIQANENGNVYQRIKYYSEQVKNKDATLITVGLGMANVESGSEALKAIATGGAKGLNWYQPEDSSELIYNVTNNFFKQLLKSDLVASSKGQVKDFISDTFYPIDKDTKLALSAGDWIDKTGKKVNDSDPSAAGQLLYNAAEVEVKDSDGQVLYKEPAGWKVVWKESETAATTAEKDAYKRVHNNSLDGFTYGNFAGWKGTVYLKAKEDFIGGNVIDTNKDAILTVNESPLYYDKPNVNVRLLDLNQNNTEVTVFLGDNVTAYKYYEDDASSIYRKTITNQVVKDRTNMIALDSLGKTPEQALQAFYDKIEFTKIVDKDGKSTVGASTYYSGVTSKQTGWITTSDQKMVLKDLKDLQGNSIGMLTTAQLQSLIDQADAAANGTATSAKIPYEYNEADGVVGYFEYTVTKTSTAPEPADFDDHQTQLAGHNVEIYTLKVTYVPYNVGDPNDDSTFRGTNAYNGTNGPGLEANSAANPMTLKSENKHIINVIDGKIEITKVLEFITAPTTSQTFSFTVKRVDVDANGNVVQITDPADNTKTVDQLHALYDFEKNSSGQRDAAKQKQERTLTITIPAGGTSPVTVTGSALTGLPRGTYKVEEVSSNMPEDYQFKSIEDNGSNCVTSVSQDGKSMLITIGSYNKLSTVTDALDVGNIKGVIALYNPGTAGKSLSEYLYQNDMVKGIVGKVKITNKEKERITDLILSKVDSDDATKFLAGAEFKIYTDQTLQTALEFYNNAAMTGNKVSILTTDTNGTFHAYGIPFVADGSTVYYMKETKAPNGYALLSDVIKLSIDKDGIISFAYGYMDNGTWTEYQDSASFSTASRMIVNSDGDADTNDVMIKDPLLYSLPSTGGTGIYWPMLMGVMLMAFAMLLLERRQS